MTKKQRNISIAVFLGLIILISAGIILLWNKGGAHGSIQDTMKDVVLNENNKISLFGILNVNPGLISAFSVTGILAVFSLILRIFVIPKFKLVPGKFQLIIETAVGFFDNLSKNNSPHKHKLLGGYVFTAGAYIFISTLFELFGFQGVTVHGHSVPLPAPLADINGAIAMGFLSYAFILIGGITANGIKGIGKTLKEFSLPLSMSFRLFGALLSGALVTELVYHYKALSFGLPIFVGVVFTLLHAIIQAYVLTMLTSLFYGEVSE